MVPVPCTPMAPVPPPAYQRAVAKRGAAHRRARARDAPTPARAVLPGGAAGPAPLPPALADGAGRRPAPLQRGVAAADRAAAHALAALAAGLDGLAARLAGLGVRVRPAGP